MWAALWNFQEQAWAGRELSILSWMVLLRPLRLLHRLDEPLSILLHKHTLCTKTDRGSSSLCSSLRGLNSTIQLRIDSSQPARACPWKFHNAAHTNVDWVWLNLCKKIRIKNIGRSEKTYYVQQNTLLIKFKEAEFTNNNKRRCSLKQKISFYTMVKT